LYAAQNNRFSIDAIEILFSANEDSHNSHRFTQIFGIVFLPKHLLDISVRGKPGFFLQKSIHLSLLFNLRNQGKIFGTKSREITMFLYSTIKLKENLTQSSLVFDILTN
jgi:hypothetical protein